jgi:competence protein ComFC
MRCILCHRISLRVVCPSCQSRWLTPHIHRRQIGSLEIVSLFGYSQIEPLLLTKHTPVGYRVFRFFGREFVAPFLETFARQDSATEPVAVIGVDEQPSFGGYAHIALLTRPIRHPLLTVRHGRLLARTPVHYAGKDLAYRLDHPRRMTYRPAKPASVILVDDIVTTGLTLQESAYAVASSGKNVLFALTLADAEY